MKVYNIYYYLEDTFAFSVASHVMCHAINHNHHLLAVGLIRDDEVVVSLGVLSWPPRQLLLVSFYRTQGGK